MLKVSIETSSIGILEMTTTFFCMPIIITNHKWAAITHATMRITEQSKTKEEDRDMTNVVLLDFKEGDHPF